MNLLTKCYKFDKCTFLPIFVSKSKKFSSFYDQVYLFKLTTLIIQKRETDF